MRNFHCLSTSSRAAKPFVSSSLRNLVIFIFFIFCLSSGLQQVSAQTTKTANKSDDSLRTVKAELQTNSKAVSNQTGNVFFAAPNGTTSGNGSINNPWDLETAFSQPAAVQPGDTVYLRGGTYKVPNKVLGFTSKLTGTLGNPIKMMSYPGEWAIIDGNISYSQIKNVTIIKIIGEYTWYMGFEITNSDTGNRKIDISGSNPTERRGEAILDQGFENKIINTVIHDTGAGISSFSHGENGEYYGNSIYNVGWDAPDRGHGDATYIQNNSDYKRLEENFLFNAFSRNSQMYGSSAAFCRNFTWIGNVMFNGSMAWWGPYLENLVVKENHFYNQQFSLNPSIYLTNTDADVEDNYFMAGVTLGQFSQNLTFKNNNIWNPGSGTILSIYTVDFWNPSKFTFDNNTYYKNQQSLSNGQFKISYINKSRDFAFNKTIEPQRYASAKKAWQEDVGLDTNSTYVTSAPSGVKAFVRPNKYDSGRANIIVYNWNQANTVNVDVSSILHPGDTYELHNVQDYFGDTTTGTYSGGQININMTNRTCAKPIGYDLVSSWYHDPLQPCTFPTFGIFVLVKNN